jgi:hypothetical protein
MMARSGKVSANATIDATYGEEKRIVKSYCPVSVARSPAASAAFSQTNAPSLVAPNQRSPWK